jgi:hypothetical protein
MSDRQPTTIRDVVNRLRGVVPNVGRKHRHAILDACDGLVELAERLQVLTAELRVAQQARPRSRAVITYPESQELTSHGQEEARPVESAEPVQSVESGAD